jgi:hypothetical protein
VGCGVREGDRVTVEINGMGEAVTTWLVFVVQLLIISAMIASEIVLKTTR